MDEENAQPATVMLYATFPDMATAEAIGRSLVEGGHVACVNVLPGLTSIYRWRGAIEEAREAAMIAKTARERAEDAIAAIVAAHPYDTPDVVALDIVAGAKRYLDWIVEETG